MTKVKIQFVSKNHALIGEPIVITTDYVPRVGELLDSEAVLKESNTTFIVTSIINKVTPSGIIPFITAQNWYKGLRAELLEQYGWLPQTEHTLKSYDEDNYYE
ncbi:hypothetical protein VT25_06280 [Photobacterium leiognathi subsp. mandapamensis]|nr:hypothetical protein VT25_06280 [Photobacterium leiognathi subsp. mandapamensis]